MVSIEKWLGPERAYSDVEVEQEAKTISEKKEDIWEFFLIHNLGRHYSQPNLLTQKINVELRSPIFENNLFDFYLSLHPRHRLSASLFRKVLIDINKKVAMIESGNFGIALQREPYVNTTGGRLSTFFSIFSRFLIFTKSDGISSMIFWFFLCIEQSLWPMIFAYLFLGSDIT